MSRRVSESFEDKACQWKRSEKLMDVHAFVRLDNAIDPEVNLLHIRQLEERFFVQVMSPPEDVKNRPVDEGLIRVSPLDGIAE